MKYKDYYEILGVARDAGTDDIKRAYRKLARKFHPDVSKEKNAEERFKEVGEAYETLKDPEKRAAYDQLGRHPPGEEFHPPPGWGRVRRGSESSRTSTWPTCSTRFGRRAAGQGPSRRAGRADFAMPGRIRRSHGARAGRSGARHASSRCSSRCRRRGPTACAAGPADSRARSERRHRRPAAARPGKGGQGRTAGRRATSISTSR